MDCQVFTGRLEVRWKQAAQHDDSCCTCPKGYLGDLQSDGKRNFSYAGQSDPTSGMPDALRDHAYQVRAAYSPMSRGSQEKHRTQCGPECDVPVGKVRHKETDTPEYEKARDQTDQRDHASLSPDREFLPAHPRFAHLECGVKVGSSLEHEKT